jgi:SAM-dependent methyltransferase
MSGAEGGYDPEFYSELYAAEDRHFWFRGRNRIIAAVLTGIVPRLSPDCRVLEVGCGNGNTMRVLRRLCAPAAVIGIDLFADGLRYARARGVDHLVQGDVSRPPFRVLFDLIGMFDVLEHIRDDIGVLHNLRDLLRTGAHLVVTVPAHASLWSYFDEASRHCRRYEAAGLAEKLRATGYQIEYMTEFMMCIYPLVWLQRKWLGRRRTGHASAVEIAKSELRINPILNGMLGGLQLFETMLIGRRKRLALGTSVLVVARKL